MDEGAKLYVMTQKQYEIVSSLLVAIRRGDARFLSDEDTFGVGTFGEMSITAEGFEMVKPDTFGHYWPKA